jgi:2-oxoglutarate dehydrogenase E2 component (dihydrolipoamide succinyltransferase)
MSSELEIRAPAEQTEGTRSQILRWLKSVGDRVAQNEPLIEIETDKVTVELALPGTGTLLEIVKQEQDEIGPGDLLGRIDVGGVANSTSAVMATVMAPSRGASGSFAGSALEARGAGGSQVAPRADSAGDRGTAQALSPAVRRLLAQNGLEPSAIAGTGQGGRVTVDDVLSHVASRADGAGAVRDESTKAGAAGSSSIDAAGPSRRVPHTAVRKRIAEHMVQSLLQTAPHVTTVFEANLGAVLQHRQRNKDDFARRGAPLTLTTYFLRAAAAGIRAVPEANSRWTDTALEIYDSMHIGVATALDTGLVVPVLRDVQSRDLFEVAQGLQDLVSRTREGRLSPADVRGGTFTISNHGVSGSLVATPIVINQPQSAILGVGKLEKRAVVVADLEDGGADRIVVEPRCYVTLTIDHRVMDGHRANLFLQTFLEHLATSYP